MYVSITKHQRYDSTLNERGRPCLYGSFREVHIQCSVEKCCIYVCRIEQCPWARLLLFNSADVNGGGVALIDHESEDVGIREIDITNVHHAHVIDKVVGVWIFSLADVDVEGGVGRQLENWVVDLLLGKAVPLWPDDIERLVVSPIKLFTRDIAVSKLPPVIAIACSSILSEGSMIGTVVHMSADWLSHVACIVSCCMANQGLIRDDVFQELCGYLVVVGGDVMARLGNCKEREVSRISPIPTNYLTLVCGDWVIIDPVYLAGLLPKVSVIIIIKSLHPFILGVGPVFLIELTCIDEDWRWKIE